jgi:micrococcal nuclease
LFSKISTMHFNFRQFFFLCLLIFLWSKASLAKDQNYQWLEISKFVDGDTFWVMDAKGNSVKIRLIGIDAPETRRTGNKEMGYFGKEASVYVKNLLTGRRIRLEFDIGKYDRYKRTLAYVFLEDGMFLNAHLVKEGYASVMTVPPNVKYANLFVNLQREAKKNNRGLWKIP